MNDYFCRVVTLRHVCDYFLFLVKEKEKKENETREREREKEGFLNVHGWFVKYFSNCFLSNLEIEVWRDEIKNIEKEKIQR